MNAIINAVGDWQVSFWAGPNGPLGVTLRHPSTPEPMSAETWRFTPDALENLVLSLEAYVETQGLTVPHDLSTAIRAGLHERAKPCEPKSFRC